MFVFFFVMRSECVKLRYFDSEGLLHLTKGLTGGQEGPLTFRDVCFLHLDSSPVGTCVHKVSGVSDGL